MTVYRHHDHGNRPARCRVCGAQFLPPQPAPRGNKTRCVDCMRASRERRYARNRAAEIARAAKRGKPAAS